MIRFLLLATTLAAPMTPERADELARRLAAGRQ